MSDLPTRLASPLDPATTTVAVVMPVLNEAEHIAGALKSVLDQTFDPERLEVLVIDGMSDDATTDIVSQLLSDRPQGRIIPNPSKSTTTGLNTGGRATRADVIVRVDGHCRLSPDYVERCVDLLAESRAGNVGGLMRPRGENQIGLAMALALKSHFGIGDSRFHYLERREYVDTVYLGAFRREVLDEIGSYDETLLANEDFEINHRIRVAGYGVLLSPEIRSTYLPRDTIFDIASQFFRYGLSKALVMRKHPESIQRRHLAAPALVVILPTSAAVFAVSRKLIWLVPAFLYAAATIWASIVTAKSMRLATALLLVFPAIHLSWGMGVVTGLLRSFATRSWRITSG